MNDLQKLMDFLVLKEQGMFNLSPRPMIRVKDVPRCSAAPS